MSTRTLTTAAAQLRRILHVIPFLADGEAHSLDEISERVGVESAVLRRDLHSLTERYAEPPGGFVDGVSLFIESDRVELISDHFRRPMRLTVSELRALELGLAMLRAERPQAEQEVVDRARERLHAVIAKLPSDPFPDAARQASFGAHGDAEHLAAVRSALRSHRKLKLVYRRGDADRATERVIHPYALAAVSGALYIVAHCERSGGIRIFRLDRVEGAKLLTDRFTIPESFSLDDVLSDGKALSSSGRPRVLKVRYSPRIARWIAEREGGETGPDGSLTVEHPLVDAGWAIRHVLRYGPDAEVLEPADVRAELRRALESMASAC
ncbi:MAG TPA: WYL domain-containing protein [Gemmatimonadaceae bacterium]|nr:WYL domain-containing protein [Gemmatimonadaceae bacterium]